MLSQGQITNQPFQFKFFVILLLLFYQFSCSSEKKNQTSLEKMTLFGQKPLNGKVQSLKITQYKAIDKFGEITTGDTLKNGAGWTESEFVFDKNGNLVKTTLQAKYREYSYFAGKVENYENAMIDEYKYNDYNNVLERRIVDKSNTLWKYTYDAQQNLIIEEYWTNENLNSKKIFVYDESNNEIEMTEYNKEGDLKNKTIYVYNKNEDVTFKNAVGYDASGKVDYIWNRRYDVAGNEIQNDYRGGSYNSLTEKTYNDRNELIEERDLYSSNEPMWVKKFVYDELGNLIRETKVDYSSQNDDYEKSYKYEFDEEKNWIKKVEYSKVHPVQIVLREIKYY